MKNLCILIAIVFTTAMFTSCDDKRQPNNGGDYPSGGSNPSFTGSAESETITGVQGYYVTSNGPVAAYALEVVGRGNSQKVRRAGYTNEYNFAVDHNYGFSYVFWDGSAWIYFYY